MGLSSNEIMIVELENVVRHWAPDDREGKRNNMKQKEATECRAELLFVSAIHK